MAHTILIYKNHEALCLSELSSETKGPISKKFRTVVWLCPTLNIGYFRATNELYGKQCLAGQLVSLYILVSILAKQINMLDVMNKLKRC